MVILCVSVGVFVIIVLFGEMFDCLCCFLGMVIYLVYLLCVLYIYNLVEGVILVFLGMLVEVYWYVIGGLWLLIVLIISNVGYLGWLFFC